MIISRKDYRKLNWLKKNRDFCLVHELYKTGRQNSVPHNAKCANPSGLAIWIYKVSNGEHTAVFTDGNHVVTFQEHTETFSES